MKKIYTFLAAAIIALSAQAQQNVSFKINHFLGNSAFAFNQATTNNLSNSFTITRLQYYISEIKLTHDGGIVTSVPDSYILVDASSTTNVNLGSYNITSLESISFGIGVESPKNNADPSVYSASHPLGPKAPSMHWGWASGYRFLALEGKTGTNFSQIFQIHALGNRNYRIQSITTGGSIQSGNIVIELNADYTQVLSGITVNSNLVNHGEFNEAATSLSNFQTSVFSQTTVGIYENDNLLSFDVYPNPSSGEINFRLDNSMQNSSYLIRDLTGREVQSGILSKTNSTIEINETGIYFLNIFNEGILIASEKIIIQ